MLPGRTEAGTRIAPSFVAALLSLFTPEMSLSHKSVPSSGRP
jgi:hypothetical protein